ncbi:hypothetical protein TNCV_4591431, partial [Trichonephila clavipes]
RTKSEKLAYQLNEEAELDREDQSGDKASCCLSEKWRIINLLDDIWMLYRGRIIGKLEEGRSVTSVAAEFGIAHSIVSRLWRQFQTTRTAIRGFSSGRRGTTPADDRYIVLQARRNRRQTAGEIARTHDTGDWTTDIAFSPWPEDCSGGLLRRPVRRYGSAVPFHGRQCTMSSHSSCRTALESEDIERMDWPA